MSFNSIQENKIFTKISGFTEHSSHEHIQLAKSSGNKNVGISIDEG